MAGETVVGALRYDFTADTSGLKSGLNEVTNSVRHVTDQLRTNSRQFEQLGRSSAQSVGLARHEMTNLVRQLNDVGVSLASGMSPFMVLIQQGGQIADVFQSSSMGAGAALKAFGAQAAAAALSVRGLTLIGGAIGGALALGISSAKNQLAELSEQAKVTGISVKTFLGAEIIGAKSGVEAEKMREALATAGKAFEQYTMNAGELKKEIQALGGDFMRLTDQSRNAGQFIDTILQKIRELPRVEGLNLAKKLFGEDQGAKLFDAIRSGEVSMRNFAKAAADAGADLDEPARKAAELKREIEATAKAADMQLFAAFGRLANPLGEVELAWQKIKVAIAEAAAAVRKFNDEQAISVPHQTGGEPTKDVFNRMRGLSSFGRLIKPEDSGIPGLSGEPAGDARKRYEARDNKSHNSARSAKEATDQVKSYIENLREAASIAQAEADNWSKGNIEREKAMALVKAENIAKQEGRTLTAAQREEIVALTGQEQLARQKVDDLKYSQDRLNDAMQEFGDQVSRSLEDLIIRGQKASEVLRQLIAQLGSAALRGMLTGEGMFGKLFGMAGDKEGGLGGILGKAISFLPKFAAGGTLGAGRWGIAGEAGPELVKGPAHITPFGKMGSQGAKVTVHNYGGEKVQTRQMSDGEILVIVGNMIQSNNKRVPGLVADAQRRSI